MELLKALVLKLARNVDWFLQSRSAKKRIWLTTLHRRSSLINVGHFRSVWFCTLCVQRISTINLLRGKEGRRENNLLGGGCHPFLLETKISKLYGWWVKKLTAESYAQRGLTSSYSELKRRQVFVLRPPRMLLHQNHFMRANFLAQEHVT